jgi:nucleoid-associated protein YejK
MNQAEQNREELKKIRDFYNAGELSRNEAIAMAQPVIDRVNKKADEIAKKYGIKKAKHIGFDEAISQL